MTQSLGVPTSTAWPSPAELVLLHHLPEHSEADASTVLDLLTRALDHEWARREQAEAAAVEVWDENQDLRDRIECWQRTSLDLHMALLEVVRRVHPEYRNGLPEDLVMDPRTPEGWPLFQEILEAMGEVFRRLGAMGWTDPAPRPYRGPRLSAFELLRAAREGREPRLDEQLIGGMDVEEVP
jgi:hypothetical protein